MATSTPTMPETATTPNAALAERILAATGQNVFLCYHCLKCSSGCPLGEYFDLAPNQVMRAAQLGLEQRALDARTPWLCAGCQTCTTRCPQGLDVAKVMDFLVMESRARGLPARVPEVALFNKVFLRNVDILGRAYELGLIAEYNLRTRQPLKDLPMGLGMLRRRTVKLLPAVVRRRRRARRLATAPVAARPAAQIGYYPGCSLHSMAAEYDHSIRAVAGALGLEFVEIPGWRCCGSSPAHRVDARRAVEMSLANLTLASDQGLGEITAPCAMCFNRLRSAQHEVAVDPAMRSAMQARLGDDLAAGVRVRSLLDVFLERIGLDGLAARVQRPLAGLTVACYYGCLLTRPPEVTGSSDTEYPMGMDRLLRALGATVVDWSDKTSCCGASLSLTRTEIALDLSARILAAARAAGADAVAVACPLCHVNLDARQHQMDPAARGAGEVPVLYVTQLMALAFGLGPEAAALARNMVDPRPLLAQKGLLT